MSFKLSSKVDSEKVFLVKKSQIEGRLDPHFYKPEFQEVLKKTSSLPTVPLHSLCSKIFSGITPKSGGDAYCTPLEGVPFVRSGDFTEEDRIEFEKLLYIKRDIHNNLMQGSQLNQGDILFAIVGATIGKVGVYKYDCEANINQAICGVRLKDDKVVSDYVKNFFLTSIGQKLLDRVKRPVARANINLNEIGSLHVPIFSEKKQREIVSKMESAYAAKKRKEAEAQELLDSIDSYLLGELGITLPEEKEQTIKDRIFCRKVSDVSGGRFDPKKYGQDIRSLKSAIKSSPYKKRTLKKLITQSCSGEWGVDVNVVDTSSLLKKCLVIRATEFDNDFNLNIDNNRMKYRQINISILKQLNIQADDLLIEKSGGSPDQPVGRIALITSELLQKNTICFSNFIQKIRVDESSIHPEYLFNYLKTIHNIKLTDSMQSQTSGIRNLIMQEYFNQDIVLPDKKIQKRISEKISEIRKRAKKLQQEASEGLEKAKAEVEVMILGEAKK